MFPHTIDLVGNRLQKYKKRLNQDTFKGMKMGGVGDAGFRAIRIPRCIRFRQRPSRISIENSIPGTVASLLVESVFVSAICGVFAFSSFWTIKEVFEQEERVLKGWFPKNPKRTYPEQKP